MELHQLEYFVAVAEEGSFTRAAARVHVAQPGVSAQVRRLESELGQRLLDRSGRAVRLTDAGTAVLPFARAALSAVANARLAVDELAGLVRGQVTVGMVSGCSIPVMPELLAGFHERYPGVSIALSEDASDRLTGLLGDGRMDLALIGSAGPVVAGLQTAVVADEALVAAVSTASPLTARTTLPVEALRDHPLICLPRGTGVRAALDAACGRAGFQPRIVLEATALPMVAQLAGRGLGVAILPASSARAHEPALHILAIGRPPVRSRLELAWHPATATSPAAVALIEHARAFVRRLEAGREPAA
ncbi:MAG TPA: LysR substrate-binding domain-containing protein [Streptosporangiaceae bacterium]|nr:LysR substrate-binding domain-containing protein [Streptosporangiaceae bacterium]